MGDAADDLEDMTERGRDTPWDQATAKYRRQLVPKTPSLPCRLKEARTAVWVARLNRLALELDETAAALHPSAWPEQLKAHLEQYREQAKRAP